MPEAAVDEHGDLSPREDDVWPDADASREVQPVIFAIPIAQTVQLATQGYLGFGV